MLKRIREWLRRRDPSDPPIHVDADGFGYTCKDGASCGVRWSEICEIRAYKIDLMAWDEVRFAFRVDGGWSVFSEEQPGFHAMLLQLEGRFPGVVGWEEKVIKPAFERNETVLYREST